MTLGIAPPSLAAAHVFLFHFRHPLFLLLVLAVFASMLLTALGVILALVLLPRGKK